MRSERRMRPGRVVCFTLSLLICCGESAGGGADGGIGETAGDIGSGTVDTWVGIASGVIGGALVDELRTDAEITWVAEPEQLVPGQTSYRARGWVRYRSGECTITPAEASIEGHPGPRLVIDWTRSPPEYAASGASMWMAKVSCGGAPADAPVGGVWLADPSTVDQLARGALLDGKEIQGRATFGDPRAVEITFRWAFRRGN